MDIRSGTRDEKWPSSSNQVGIVHREGGSMDEHRQHSTEGSRTMSEDAPCRKSMDDLLTNYADEYIQDVHKYLTKLEEAISIRL